MQFVTRSALCLGALVLLGWSSRATAQARKLELGGFGGSYVPTNDDGIEKTIRDASRRGSLAYGGRLTYWTSKAVGVEVTGGYSPARVSVTAVRGTFPRSTDLWFGSGKVALNLTPGSNGLGFALSGGLSVLHTQGTVIDPAVGATDVGGVGGLSVRVPAFGVIIRGDLEDYFYGGDFGKGNKFTQDLVLSAGVSFRF